MYQRDTKGAKRMRDKTGAKRAYNRRTYTTKLFRYRTDSELAERLAAFADSGDRSINLLITNLLCDFFNIGLPHKKYSTYNRKRYFPLEDADLDVNIK